MLVLLFELFFWVFFDAHGFRGSAIGSLILHNEKVKECKDSSHL